MFLAKHTLPYCYMQQAYTATNTAKVSLVFAYLGPDSGQENWLQS